MAAYRVALRLESPVATPFRSGTLFGHLCWAWRHDQGEESLTSWIRSLKDRPFLISDAFPTGWLPRPLLKPWRPPSDAVIGKKIRKAAWVKVEDFLSLRDRLSEEELIQRLAEQPEMPLEHRVAHNTIDRRTGTTPREGGGLYFMDERWPSDSCRNWDVYVDTELEADQLQRLFTKVGEFGFGRDASIGRGKFTAEVGPAPKDLFAGKGTRRMSLSHGSLTSNMERVRYRLRTHYGKVGSFFASSGNPFKHPITLLQPGATFTPTGDGPYGELLEGVCPGWPGVVENSWHLTVPYTEKEG